MAARGCRNIKVCADNKLDRAGPNAGTATLDEYNFARRLWVYLRVRQSQSVGLEEGTGCR
jgi:hypothetical protein